jgi:hypothetical protein
MSNDAVQPVAADVLALLQEPHQQPSHGRRQLLRASVAYAITRSPPPASKRRI